MIKRTLGTAALVLALAGGMTALPTSNAQADTANVIYKHAEGNGTIRCDNGQRASVKIAVVGGGLTAGKYKITNGTGEISTVNGIKDVFGDYAQAGADAGLVKSANAQVLTKGTTSLALAGTGEGVNLGISAGKFTISPR
jgi:hypothetical protein